MMSVNNTAKAKVSYHLAFLRPGTNLENTEFHKMDQQGYLKES